MDARFGTKVAEEKTTPDEAPSQPADFAGVTILQLYVFLWKMLAANLLFALPFAIIYFLIFAR